MGTEALYGPWDYSKRPDRFPYDDTITYREAGAYLDAPGVVVEDWGCGGGWLQRHLPHAVYRGVDGAAAPWVDVLADLRTYRSQVPRAHMRHVLEHNPEWRTLLANFLESWSDRAVITTWVPFRGEPCMHRPCPQDDDPPPGDVDHGRGEWAVPDLHMVRADFEAILGDHGVTWDSQGYTTTSQYGHEELFWLVKP